MQYPSSRFQYRRDIEKMCRKELTEQSESFILNYSLYVLMMSLKVVDKLEPAINEYMEGVKRQRLEKERKALLSERLTVLKKAYSRFKSSVPIINTDLIATDAEIFMEPCIRDIIVNLPKTETLAKKDLHHKLAVIFHTANERVRKTIDKQLLKHTNAAYKAAGGDHTIDPTTVFGLATTLFRCKTCSQHYWYDAIVAHKCTRTNAFPKDLPDADIIADCLGSDKYRSHENISVEVNGIAIGKYLIKLCGLDPSTTSRSTLDEINPIFECLLCNDEASGRATMTWSRAVSLSLFNFNPL